MALALRRAQIALGEQPAEPPIGGAILRIDDGIGRAVDEGEPRAGDDAQRADRRAVLAREDMRAHDAGERVAIGDADPRPTRAPPRARPFLGVRGAAQKRKVGRRRELGEARARRIMTSLPPLAGEGRVDGRRVGG